MIKRTLFLAALITAGCLGISAQSVIWQLRPAEYAGLRYYGNGLYEVTQNGHIGLIRNDGTQVVPPQFDVITPFHEGKALLLTRESGGNVVGGYLTNDGRYTPFSKKYYTITGIDFYSCDMLPVTDASGKKGYLDASGAEVLGFNGSFDQVTPFSEGYASVFNGKGKDKKYALIDRRGNKAMFHLGLGEVYSGTNVYNGKATIWDTNGKFYAYDTATGRCTEMRKPSNTNLDYLFCFSGISGRTREIPYTSPAMQTTTGLAPTMGANGLYGYSTSSRQILPPQFSEATPFIDGIAVVTLNGRRGLLRWVENGNDFAIDIPKQEITYEAGQKVTCRFTLTPPETWRDKEVTLDVADATTGEKVNGNYAQDTYTFTLVPTEKSKTLRLSAHADGLTLWTGEATFNFRRLETNLHIAIAIAGDIANKNNQVPVTVTISNNGLTDITTDVHITGSSTLIEKHDTVVIPAKGSTQLHSAFIVKQDVNGQYINVTTSKGFSASRKGLKFETYY